MQKQAEETDEAEDEDDERRSEEAWSNSSVDACRSNSNRRKMRRWAKEGGEEKEGEHDVEKEEQEQEEEKQRQTP